MSSATVQVDNSGAKIALGKLGAAVVDLQPLYSILGQSQLVSVRRTFREQGSPAGSWVPLSPNTISRNPKQYGAGHKLLIGKAVLLNSITVASTSGGVVIGTNVPYAAVHNFGSRDRGGAIGPQARLADRAATVGAYQYMRTRALYYGRREVIDAKGKKYLVPIAIESGETEVFGKSGKRLARARNRNYHGPQQQIQVKVAAHKHFQNIPARPYMVFRPEDPQRLQDLSNAFLIKAAKSAGLEAS